MKNRIVVGLVAAVALAVAAPAAPAQDSGDAGEICDSLFGSDSSTIDLSPLANINLSTCKEAQTPSCSDGGTPLTISLLPLANVNLRIC